MKTKGEVGGESNVFMKLVVELSEILIVDFHFINNVTILFFFSSSVAWLVADLYHGTKCT